MKPGKLYPLKKKKQILQMLPFHYACIRYHLK
jgi:hypothetical protein